MLVSLSSVLKKAQKNKYAVGAFNINNLEILQGVLEAAVRLKSPVIFQTSEGAIQYAGMEYLVALVKTAEKLHEIPIVLHLDHGKNLEVIEKAIFLGYDSVMFDGSALPMKENIKITRRIVKFAHKKRVDVEAEIGVLAGVEDLVRVQKQNSFLTVPEQAKIFVEKTQCDALAIAIGTSHGAYKFMKKPMLDIDRLKQIRKYVTIPLVLHGASSVPQEMVSYANKYCKRLHLHERIREGAQGVPNKLLQLAIQNGITKINIDTDLRIAFTGAVLNTLVEHETAIDPREYLQPARDLVRQVAEQKIRIFGSVNRG